MHTIKINTNYPKNNKFLDVTCDHNQGLSEAQKMTEFIAESISPINVFNVASQSHVT